MTVQRAVLRLFALAALSLASGPEGVAVRSATGPAPISPPSAVDFAEVVERQVEQLGIGVDVELVQ